MLNQHLLLAWFCFNFQLIFVTVFITFFCHKVTPNTYCTSVIIDFDNKYAYKMQTLFFDYQKLKSAIKKFFQSICFS